MIYIIFQCIDNYHDIQSDIFVQQNNIFERPDLLATAWQSAQMDLIQYLRNHRILDVYSYQGQHGNRRMPSILLNHPENPRLNVVLSINMEQVIQRTNQLELEEVYPVVG